MPFSVIPAEAGISESGELPDPGACPRLDPGFARETTLVVSRRENAPVGEGFIPSRGRA
jgi:hypothetical protein